jgi:hypothetical protein
MLAYLGSGAILPKQYYTLRHTFCQDKRPNKIGDVGGETRKEKAKPAGFKPKLRRKIKTPPSQNEGGAPCTLLMVANGRPHGGGRCEGPG